MNLFCSQSLPPVRQVAPQQCSYQLRVKKLHSLPSYHYTPQIQHLLVSSLSSRIASTLPINKLLRQSAKMLDLNLFQAILLHWLLKSTAQLIQSHVSGRTPWDYSSVGLIQALRVFDQFTYEDQAYSGLFAFVLLNGYYVKSHVNSQQYLEKLIAHSISPIVAAFEQIYSKWTRVASLKSLTMTKINQIFISYASRNFALHPSTAEFNYNMLVDRLLELSKPYNIRQDNVESIQSKQSSSSKRSSVEHMEVVRETSTENRPRRGRKPTKKYTDTPPAQKTGKCLVQDKQAGASVQKNKIVPEKQKQKKHQKKKQPQQSYQKPLPIHDSLPAEQVANQSNTIPLGASVRRSLRRTRVSPPRVDEDQRQQTVNIPIPLSQEDNFNMAMFQSASSMGGYLNSSLFRDDKKEFSFRFMQESRPGYPGFGNMNNSLGYTRGPSMRGGRRVTAAPTPTTPPEIKRTGSEELQ